MNGVKTREDTIICTDEVIEDGMTKIGVTGVFMQLPVSFYFQKRSLLQRCCC